MIEIFIPLEVCAYVVTACSILQLQLSYKDIYEFFFQ